MLNPYPSTALKSAALDIAFEECGRAGYEFDRSPGEDASALRRLDALLAEWQAQGIALNYNFPAIFGQSQPTDPMGIPDAAMNAVASWLAFRMAPGMGKTMSAESRKAMADGRALLIAETAAIPSMVLPHNTPRGMGNKPYAVWYPFSTDSLDCGVTLDDLVLSDATALATNGYAGTLGGFSQGAQLTLVDNQGGKYVLYGSLLVGSGLTAGTDAPVVRQTLPGATNSPYDTTLAIAVS